MQKIEIKNFGPISNAEIEIKKILVLIGDNAMGKSTVTKLISNFVWMEKALFRSSEKEWFEKENRFKNFFLSYHRNESFLKEDTVIEYHGKAFVIKYSNNKISIENQTDKDNNYQLPQIMYVPAERNFLTYLRTTKDLQSGGALQDFERELTKASENLEKTLSLPIRDFEIEYNKRHKMLYVKNKNHTKIKITEAASGLQSAVPLFLVSDYLSKLVHNSRNIDTMKSSDIREFEKDTDKIADEIFNNILNDKNLSEKQKHIAIAKISSKISPLSNKFNRKAFINIVEEPEQNLFPMSQMQLVKSLVEICNKNTDNKLIISTHSPYVLATINNLILAHKVGEKFSEKVAKKVNRNLWLNKNDVFAGIIKDGKVEKIIDPEFDIIQQEHIDSVSQIINEEFDYLYQYKTTENA